MVSRTTNLASKLVSIPSYVSDDRDERVVIDYLARYARTYLPSMTVELSPVNKSGRSNLYIKGLRKTKLAFVGHVDTVQPSAGWKTPPLEPTVIGNKLYGLGAADMKGSIASLLVALRSLDASLLSDVAVLLYVDEEYQFAGMKQLVKDGVFSRTNQPELVISLDGGLEVLSGCRGLIKIDMELIGKSGHASNPANGVNAITNTMAVLSALQARLKIFSSDLGNSTMNVARMNGGAVANIESPTQMQRSGNVIPNYADCIIEIRTASADLTAATVERIIRTECEKRKLRIKSLDVKVNLGVWQSSSYGDMTTFIQECYSAIGLRYTTADPRYIGYIDVQMLAEAIDAPIYVIGAGGENRHGANENVPIANLESARTLYQTIITKFAGETT